MATTTTFMSKLQDIGDRFVEGVKAEPLVRRFVTGQATKAEYVGFLQQAYHYVKATTPNLSAASRSLRQGGRPEHTVLADRLAEHAAEERGHHRWILDDLEALGEPRERIDQIEICPAIQAYL